MIIQNKPQAENLFKTFHKIYEWAVANRYNVIHRRHEGVVAVPREKRLLMASPWSGVNIFGAALLYFHAKDSSKYNWISFSTTRTLAEWLNIDPSVLQGEKMLRGFMNGYFAKRGNPVIFPGEEYGYYPEKGFELARFIMNKDNSNQDRFANAARLLLCGNGDFNSLAKDLQKVLEEYDGVHLGSYNKLTRMANELPKEVYEKYSADVDDPKAWNKDE